MGWLILSFFLVIFSFASFLGSQQESDIVGSEFSSVANQRANETVIYINAINDYLYSNPIQNGVLTNQQIGVSVNPNLKHIISGGRVYVYQEDTTGLINAIKLVTKNSSLLGVVVNRRLIDFGNVDMSVTVPAQIPNGYVVYLN